MATKPLKTLTFEGLDDIYTVPQIDASLSTTGKAADAKATGDSLAEKASVSGMVDMAKSLVGGKYTSDKQPYHFRKSPSAGAKEEVIVGGSLAWNQLVQISDYETTTNNGVTYTNNGDGSITVNGTATALSFITHSFYLNQNHVYYWHICPSNGSSSTYFGDTGANLGRDNGNGGVGKYTGTSETKYFRLYVQNGVTVSNLKVYPQLIDLTVCFGTTIADYIYTLEQANAGAGVAWVKRYIDLDTYHEYDAGSIQSVEGLVSHDVVGFNQWDEETALGYYDPSNNGAFVSNSGWMACKNYIPCLPNTDYYMKIGTPSSGSFGAFLFYDGDKNYMSYSSSGGVANRIFTTPSNCHYMTFYANKTWFAENICINISDPSRNGTYEPYEKHSYPLDSDVVLRGVPKLVTDHIEFDGDKYLSDGTLERRYGIVDLGSLNWSYESDVFRLNSDIGAKKETNMYAIANIICPKYPTVSQATMGLQGTDKVIAGLNWSNGIRVCDSAYTDAATFKTAMSGVMLVYPLATPTTETAQPFQSPMLVGQTEEYVSDSVVPVGHESRYYEDITGKVNNLPSDFSTLIAPVEVTFKATRNYTVGSYLILNNTLYKVTANIANGGTITPNTNVTATTIMAEIMAL